LHEVAANRYLALIHARRPILLSDWIIAETGNGLARTTARNSLRDAVTLLVADPRTNLVIVDESRMQQALELYAQRSDKTWGLVDCSTMLMMEEFGSTEVFTSDFHFEQAGFTAMLR
jgi:hypothetical protein